MITKAVIDFEINIELSLQEILKTAHVNSKQLLLIHITTIAQKMWQGGDFLKGKINQPLFEKRNMLKIKISYRIIAR